MTSTGRTPPPLPAYSWPRRLWERVHLTLSGDPWGTLAWHQAILHEPRAVRLARARIAPDTRDGERPQRLTRAQGGWAWIEAIRANHFHQEAGCLIWIHALPGNADGRRWRTRALWAGVEKANPAIVAAALAGGLTLMMRMPGPSGPCASR